MHLVSRVDVCVAFVGGRCPGVNLWTAFCYARRVRCCCPRTGVLFCPILMMYVSQCSSKSRVIRVQEKRSKRTSRKYKRRSAGRLVSLRYPQYRCSLPESASSKYQRPKPVQTDVERGGAGGGAARERQTMDALEFVGMGCEGCGFSRFDVVMQRGGDDDV